MQEARLIAAAILAHRAGDALDNHRIAHWVRALEDELGHAYACTPPPGSYRAQDPLCSAGWQCADAGEPVEGG
jgi:hypothetical protein